MASTAHLVKYKKGEGGRPKGVPNKLTTSVRETFQQVFDKAQRDPKLAQYSLMGLLKKDMKLFYILSSKLIPVDVQNHLTKDITIRVVPLEDKPAEPSIIDIPHEVIQEEKEG